MILVGHSIGGACISFAMECFPELISKAIFIAATMVSNNQSAFDILSKHVSSFKSLNFFFFSRRQDLFKDIEYKQIISSAYRLVNHTYQGYIAFQ